MSNANQPPSPSTYRNYHLLCLFALLGIATILWVALAYPVPVPFWISIVIPIAHQNFVWIVWRRKLNSATLISFQHYLGIFMALLLARPISLCWLAISDRGSLPIPPAMLITITIVLGLLSAYASYSVFRYFGIKRASGADHFFEEYKSLPLVDQGIFRYTRNGMYLYAFLGLWAIAVGFASSAALVSAMFAHGYIWVHFFLLEKPDMKYIYGNFKSDP